MSGEVAAAGNEDKVAPAASDQVAKKETEAPKKPKTSDELLAEAKKTLNEKTISANAAKAIWEQAQTQRHIDDGIAELDAALAAAVDDCAKQNTLADGVVVTATATRDAARKTFELARQKTDRALVDEKQGVLTAATKKRDELKRLADKVKGDVAASQEKATQAAATLEKDKAAQKAADEKVAAADKEVATAQTAATDASGAYDKLKPEDLKATTEAKRTMDKAEADLATATSQCEFKKAQADLALAEDTVKIRAQQAVLSKPVVAASSGAAG
jgi:hypothetical protein